MIARLEEIKIVFKVVCQHAGACAAPLWPEMSCGSCGILPPARRAVGGPALVCRSDTPAPSIL